MNRRILIIDDEKTIRQSLKAGLTDQEYSVYTHSRGEGVFNQLKKQSPHLVILDLKLPDINGVEVLEKIMNYDPDIFVIMITAYGNTKTAVETIKKGAFDYIEKPFDLDELNVVINKAFGTKDLKNEVKLLKKQQKDYFGDNKIIGQSKELNEVIDKIDVLSNEKEVRVLITGETGVGKGVAARRLHEKSSNRDNPFVEINCGTIAPNLIESELFGYEKNAFTGADQLKKGLIEVADGGTVFLDEIGELSKQTQVKILRFLEEKKFKRVGGVKDINVDVRIIAATNRNLEDEVKNGKFRKDLYYRLNVVRIDVPPLRKRRKDILPLAKYFLGQYSKELGKGNLEFTDRSMDRLKSYNWPGNVRELKNIIERMLIFIDAERTLVDQDDLPGGIKQLDDQNVVFDSPKKEGIINKDIINQGFSLEEELETIEKRYIELAMEKADGKKTKTAELLNISRYSLYRRLEKYNI
jgi:two-component system response regulator AtoC